MLPQYYYTVMVKEYMINDCFFHITKLFYFSCKHETNLWKVQQSLTFSRSLKYKHFSSVLLSGEFFDVVLWVEGELIAAPFWSGTFRKSDRNLLNQYEMLFQLPTAELSAACKAEDRRSAETALVPPLLPSLPPNNGGSVLRLATMNLEQGFSVWGGCSRNGISPTADNP